MSMQLTRAASIKFASIADAADEARDRVQYNQRRIGEAQKQLGTRQGKDDKAAAEALTAEIERLTHRRDHDQASYVHLTRIATAIRSWLQQVVPGFEFHDVTKQLDFMELTDGESTDKAVDRCRHAIEKLQAARRSIATSVPPLENLHASVSAHVMSLAARGKPLVGVDRGNLVIKHEDRTSFGNNTADAVNYLAWLFPNEMLEKLCEQIDEQRAGEIKRGVVVLSTADRDKKLADLDKRILALEREEEFYIESAEAFNMFIPRRESANPLAILKLSLNRVKAKAVA